nr:RHS repeat-associated core domain-containing protein [Chryseobacterium sp. MEBOG06]
MSGSFGTSNFGSFYSYKYNGKELQETGMYDYGARMMMPDLGRWGAMDAMSEKYSSWSPYNYAINNPVMVIDPDGNDAMFASGEAAQFAFKMYVATMSTGTGTSGENIFTGLNFSQFEIDCPKCKKTKKDGQKMISSARSMGLNFAADNMEYFLNGQGVWSDDKNVSASFLKSNSSVRHGTALNVTKLFGEKFNKQIENMKLGETIMLNGNWKDSYYASANELDLLYGSGGYTIGTSVSLKVTRGTIPGANGYTFSGNINVNYFDTYNWDAGKGDYVPGIGYTNDNDFNDLVENGQAANFNMNSSWNIKVSDWGYVKGSVQAGIINKIMQTR